MGNIIWYTPLVANSWMCSIVSNVQPDRKQFFYNKIAFFNDGDFFCFFFAPNSVESRVTPASEKSMNEKTVFFLFCYSTSGGSVVY
jgi:hypothetical protein